MKEKQRYIYIYISPVIWHKKYNFPAGEIAFSREKYRRSFDYKKVISSLLAGMKTDSKFVRMQYLLDLHPASCTNSSNNANKLRNWMDYFP